MYFYGLLHNPSTYYSLRRHDHQAIANNSAFTVGLAGAIALVVPDNFTNIQNLTNHTVFGYMQTVTSSTPFLLILLKILRNNERNN